MDSYELNRIAGWVLTAVVSVLGLSIISGYMFTPKPLDKPAYIVEGVETAASAEAGPAAEESVIALLASASPERGANQYKKCAACHTIEKGGANGIGPNLYGIVGRNHAQVAGFAYSAAMAATSDKPWDWDALDQWLKAPKAYIPGNKMSFAGLSKVGDRADLIAYLNTMTDAPLPLPAAPAAEAPAADAAAEAPAEEAATEAEAAPTA